MQRKAICAYQSENPKIPAAVNMVKACVSHSIVYMTQEVPRTTMEKKAVYKSAGGHQMIWIYEHCSWGPISDQSIDQMTIGPMHWSYIEVKISEANQNYVD